MISYQEYLMTRWVLSFQGIYYLLTGVWPLVGMATFEFVSGTKTDKWLVNTVGVLPSQGLPPPLPGFGPRVGRPPCNFVGAPKPDKGLANPAGARPLSMGPAPLPAARRSPPSRETLVLSITSSLAFTAIDLIY